MKPIDANQTTFTVGEVSRLCQISNRIVRKWIDTGRLKGYELPDSKHRRVDREELLRFMEEYRFPVPAELQPQPVLPALVSSHWRSYIESLGSDDLSTVAMNAVERLIQENKVVYQPGEGLVWRFSGEPLVIPF